MVTPHQHIISQMSVLDRIEADHKLPPEPPRPWATVRERRDVKCPDCGRHYHQTKMEFCKCGGYLQEVRRG